MKITTWNQHDGIVTTIDVWAAICAGLRLEEKQAAKGGRLLSFQVLAVEVKTEEGKVV